MTQEPDVDALVRQRIRSLREARGWSLDALAARCFLSPSTLSRIETGHRRIALDQLVPIAQALETSLDALIESGDDADVVIRPQADSEAGRTMWILSRGGASGSGPIVAKLRMTPTRPVPVDQLGVHPGRDWFTVLSGPRGSNWASGRSSWRRATPPSSRPWCRTPSARTAAWSRS